MPAMLTKYGKLPNISIPNASKQSNVYSIINTSFFIKEHEKLKRLN